MVSGSSLRLGESILGAFVLAIGLFVAFETYEMGSTTASTLVGPQLFPFLVATGLIIVGVALLREAVFGHVAHESGFDLDWRAVAIAAGGLLLQMLIIESAGWIIATTAMFVATTLAFGERRVMISLLIGLILAGLTFAIFTYGLGLDLPIGTVIEGMLPSPQGGE